MTIYLDASALVALHIDSPLKDTVSAVMATDSDWCTGALALVEALALVDRVTDEAVFREDLESFIRRTWDQLAVVPMDQPCLDRAARLMRDQPLRLSDALHLAAADRLPRPIHFVTFDAAQIPVALSLGYDVVSS